MCKVIKNINSLLRIMIVFAGAMALIIKLADNKKEQEISNDGFQTRDFDDIC
ncbi:MAG: hypothetical protein PUB75_05610 [Firmicutes bacterium]|nr:hypothetical protein [Bacillota bacterium]